jgi:hypothetical protein
MPVARGAIIFPMIFVARNHPAHRALFIWRRNIPALQRRQE